MRALRPQSIGFLLWLVTVLPAAAQATAPVAPRTAPAERAAATITAAELHEHVSFLASDELRGRGTPSPGLEQAATYIADHFRTLGLTPAGDDGTFIRRFPLQHVSLDRAGLLVEARAAADTVRPDLGSDLFVLPARADSLIGVPLYAGRAQAGATLPAEAAGRIVVFFVSDTVSPAWQVAVASAMQAAFAARAGAAVLVLDSIFPARSVADIAHELESSVGPLPLIGMSYDAGRRMFRAAGMELGAVRGRTGSVTPMQGVSFAIRARADVETARVPNVVAYLPGSDPSLRDEYVVYSAHFDHLGVGAPDATGDSIYSGADDNASGTSALLAVARAFTSLGAAPARSVMFVLVSAEEIGLVGSRHFVENPPVPVEQMVANINADMIGRNAADSIVAIGQDYSSLGPSAQAVAARHPELGLVVAPDLWPEEQLFFRSDHFSFAAQGIPAIFFTTGLHEQYHQPSDRVELIDTDKLARISRLMFLLGHDVAAAAERPQWTEEGRAEVRRVTGATR